MEEWRDIKGYEKYQISNLGRVRSLNYRQTGRVQVLRPKKGKCGYLHITLYKDGYRKHYQVHRLVAQAFLENPDNLPQVNHKDENPSNNRAENLEYCTAKYNTNYGNRNQKMSEALRGVPFSEEHKRNKSIPVAQFSKEGKLIAVYYGANEAERQTGIANSHITTCCKGRYKSAGGFIWKYANSPR